MASFGALIGSILVKPPQLANLATQFLNMPRSRRDWVWSFELSIVFPVLLRWSVEFELCEPYQQRISQLAAASFVVQIHRPLESFFELHGRTPQQSDNGPLDSWRAISSEPTLQLPEEMG